MTTRGLMVLVMGTVGCGEPSGEVSVATWNVGLARFAVPYTRERVQPVATAVAGLDADVICLQEVWDPDDFDAIVAAGTYDTVVRHPDAEGVSSCSTLQLDIAESCAEEHCPDLCAEDLLICLNTHCPEAVPTGGCLMCAMETMNGCRDEIRMQCEGSEGGEWLFEGYDTALLTRLPVVESDTLALDSTLVPTAISFARVDSPAGEVDVYCSHFASPTGGIEYSGPHGSWQGERAFQIQQTVEYIATRSGGTGRVVLLGDLNETVGAEGLAPFTAAGLRSAAELGEPGCTLCTDNTIEPRASDSRVDHVTIGERLDPVSFEVILDELVSLETLEGPMDLHLSDHYGLRAVLSN